jgi:hypothetical protein
LRVLRENDVVERERHGATAVYRLSASSDAQRVVAALQAFKAP